MKPENARSDESDALRTEALQAAAKELQQDVADRKGAKQKLSQVSATLQAEILARTRAESEFNRMFEATPDMMALGGFDGFYKRVNPAMLETLGYTEAEMLGISMHDLIHPADFATMGEQSAVSVGGSGARNIYYRVKHKSGRYLNTEWTDVPMVEGGLFLTMGRDITARMEMEESLHDALASMRYAQRIGMVGSWEVDVATGVSEWSDEAYRICGLVPGEVTPHLNVFYGLVHPDDQAMVRELLEPPFAEGEQRRIDYRFVLKDGSERSMHARMEMVFDDHGNPCRLRGTCQDTTEHRAAILLRARLEEQLRLAQKMEAVGSLAGGVAHDFNNLMSVILSYVGFVTESLPETDARRADLAEVQKAAERASDLTRQLLAFGRQQVLEPVPLNMNQVANSMESMLRRIIGEDITLEQNLDPELGLAMADPGQVEQVVMNLVTNACDAMPQGGSLTVETRNVEFEDGQVSGLSAGRYVMLSVEDSGTGMDAEAKARAFEPFFTTKEVGKGTGLGLPTAYGIVKQSGGNISIYSELGVGTTVRIYLPRTNLPEPAATEQEVSPEPEGGDETILVVEDEAGVRNSISRILSAAGYTVITAVNGADAMCLLETHHGEIELVLTDVIMPKMNGAELAKELERRWPGTHVLFMSGYSGDAIVHKGILEPGTEFIGKPFKPAELKRKVRQLLDSQVSPEVSKTAKL